MEVRGVGSRDPWTPEEVAVVFDASLPSDEVRSQLIGRSVRAIQKRRNRVRLGETPERAKPRWTKAADQVLMSSALGTDMERSHAVGRTYVATQQRRVFLERRLALAETVEAIEVDLALAEDVKERTRLYRDLAVAKDARRSTAHLR